ncbi:MAG: Gfo/Idh/MocA family oxidoreductase [Dehalococcoidia bacterium]
MTPAFSAVQLAAALSEYDFSGCSATVVGYGYMGRHYLQTLQALGVKRIHVCSRSEASVADLKGTEGVTVVSGGYQKWEVNPLPGELGIVCCPTADLVGAARHLAAGGFRKLLIEKPISLQSRQIESLAELLQQQEVDAACAYNRVSYPSFIEAKFRAQEEGGITSCSYAFTEFVDRIGPGSFPDAELARWGVANSLHVIGMAHGLIGLPQSWNGHRSGAVSWHPTGAIFVGSGISEQGIPFSYHADWGSKGRWSVEIHTPVVSYSLCPLEKLYRKETATGAWEEVPVGAFDPELKAGIAEQVATMLISDRPKIIPLVSVNDAARLTKYGEELFGYPEL